MKQVDNDNKNKSKSTSDLLKKKKKSFSGAKLATKFGEDHLFTLVIHILDMFFALTYAII